MSKQAKILMQNAKIAFQNKQFKEAEGICQVSHHFRKCCSFVPRKCDYEQQQKMFVCMLSFAEYFAGDTEN